MQIKLLKEAQRDIEDGIFFYERQSVGLGGYFYRTIISDIESLLVHVGIHMKVDGFHRLLSKKFPYAIYYKFNDENIFIYAVFDCRKEPKKLKERLFNI